MSSDPELERAREISRTHSDELLSKPNVVAVGLGYRQGTESQLTLVVMVEQKVPIDSLAEGEVVPTEIEGLPVEVRVVGEVSTQAEGENQGE